jgi:hypothetical protein
LRSIARGVDAKPGSDPWTQFHGMYKTAAVQLLKLVIDAAQALDDAVPTDTVLEKLPKHSTKTAISSLLLGWAASLKRDLNAFSQECLYVSPSLTKKPAAFQALVFSNDQPPFMSALSKLTATLAHSAFGVIQTLLDERKFNWKQVLLAHARVTFSTLSTAGSLMMQKLVMPRKPMVIQDEATQATEASTLMVLNPEIVGLVMVGDQKQLSATILSPLCAEHGYGRSLFERLILNGYPSIMLNIQYRMHSDISAWPAAQFYDGALTNGPNVNGSKHWHGLLPPLKFIDLKSGNETKDPNSMSTINHKEAEEVIRQLKLLLSHLKTKRSTGPPVNVGIISFYKGQTRLMTSMLQKTQGFRLVGDQLCVEGLLAVSINTIDGFQGQERDIIILSPVRTHMHHSLGFVGNAKRLNVALTRAKHSLLVVTKVKCMTRHPLWQAFVGSANARSAKRPSTAYDILLGMNSLKLGSY